MIYSEILYFHFNFLFKISIFELLSINSMSSIKVLKNGELNIIFLFLK